jgi:hypothetical protein
MYAEQVVTLSWPVFTQQAIRQISNNTNIAPVSSAESELFSDKSEASQREVEGKVFFDGTQTPCHS